MGVGLSWLGLPTSTHTVLPLDFLNNRYDLCLEARVLAGHH